MEKTTVYLDRDDYRRLKQLAKRQRRKPAQLIREAVAKYTAAYAKGRRLPKSVGGVDSGLGDLSKRDEEYLVGFGEDR